MAPTTVEALRRCVERATTEGGSDVSDVSDVSAVHGLGASLRDEGWDVRVRRGLGSRIASKAARTLRHTFLVCHVGGTDLIVEPSFSCHFEVVPSACTPEYAREFERQPRVFVGGQAELLAILAHMASAAVRSFAARGMAVPPWRTLPALASKWLPACRSDAHPLRLS